MFRRLAAGLAAGLLMAGALAQERAWVPLGADGQASVRVLAGSASCPVLNVDGKPQAMTLRAPAQTVAPRGSAQGEGKPAVFAQQVCELALARGVREVKLGAQRLPVPAREARRIVVLGDTGCRLKRSETAFQPCADAREWAWPAVAKAAAGVKPELVVHVGDYHYRESPCPANQPGCANSPWGPGADVWEADFFAPAAPLLAAAPWIFARGNHESCQRGGGGQGWSRFFDPRPFAAASSCDVVANDDIGDFGPPYRVPVGGGWQFIVFDSARVPTKAAPPDDPVVQRYGMQMRAVGALASQAPHSIFVSHHPVRAFDSNKKDGLPHPGMPVLEQAMRANFGGRLFPAGVDLALHGHWHVFEAVGFAGDYPATIISGNAGAANEGRLPAKLPADWNSIYGAAVREFASRGDFGFVLLEKKGGGWLLSEHDVDGHVVQRCRLRGTALACK